MPNTNIFKTGLRFNLHYRLRVNPPPPIQKSKQDRASGERMCLREQRAAMYTNIYMYRHICHSLNSASPLERGAPV